MHPHRGDRINVVHVTPHLGGGVGKALANLAASAATAKSDIRHSFILLEEPQKTQFIDVIRELGCSVTVVRPDSDVRGLL
ncbi:MAG: hypothetical protein IIA75_09805, partial [Proteobacteria bacterium]|nr:hypothetical protein [Pseudomonadota bacterium]